MQFYLVPATATQPERLEPTQDLARSACKARGLKPSAFSDYEVPTDKAGLMGFVNDLMAHQRSAPVQPSKIDQAECPNAPPAEGTDVARHAPWGRGDLASDGHPETRGAFTAAQVSAFALPKSEMVRDVCHLVAKMNAGELGFVALEVIARGARLGGVAA